MLTDEDKLYLTLACPFIKNWDLLTGFEWCTLIIKYPHICSSCDWSKLEAGTVGWLLTQHPIITKYFSWSNLNEREWIQILKFYPQSYKYLDIVRYPNLDYYQRVAKQKFLKGEYKDEKER